MFEKTFLLRLIGGNRSGQRTFGVANTKRQLPIGMICLTLFLVGAASRQGNCGERDDRGTNPAKALGELVAIGKTHKTPNWIYVITPGMGGMKDGDRFFRLAESIHETCPHVNVFLVDWNDAANQRICGINIPQLVAKSINPVAQDVAEQLRSLEINSTKLTLIGESFGNCVNDQVARRLGGVNRILAFNPANELGGYPLPQLENHSEIAWAFHTRSPFDTNAKIGDRGILLQPASEDPFAQHIYGVQWLEQCLSSGDASWLHFERVLPASPTPQFYDLQIGADGSLDFEGAVRIPPESEKGAIASNLATTVESP